MMEDTTPARHRSRTFLCDFCAKNASSVPLYAEHKKREDGDDDNKVIYYNNNIMVWRCRTWVHLRADHI